MKNDDNDTHLACIVSSDVNIRTAILVNNGLPAYSINTVNQGVQTTLFPNRLSFRCGSEQIEELLVRKSSEQILKKFVEESDVELAQRKTLSAHSFFADKAPCEQRFIQRKVEKLEEEFGTMYYVSV